MGRRAAFGTVKNAARVLRRVVPADLPIRVRRLAMKDAGDCDLRPATEARPKHYEIRICTSLTESAAVLILLHEWAHALAWHKEGSDHGPEWGIAYARVYRLYAKEELE